MRNLSTDAARAEAASAVHQSAVVYEHIPPPSYLNPSTRQQPGPESRSWGEPSRVTRRSTCLVPRDPPRQACNSAQLQLKQHTKYSTVAFGTDAQPIVDASRNSVQGWFRPGTEGMAKRAAATRITTVPSLSGVLG